jgi:hypothetical protein
VSNLGYNPVETARQNIEYGVSRPNPRRADESYFGFVKAATTVFGLERETWTERIIAVCLELFQRSPPGEPRPDWVPSASFVEADREKTSVDGQKLPEMVVGDLPTFASGIRKSEITKRLLPLTEMHQGRQNPPNWNLRTYLLA